MHTCFFMLTDWHLIVHNVGSIISAIAIFGLTVFVVLNNPRSRPAIVFSLMLASVLVFVVSHVIGVNVTDPTVSRAVLMFNVSIFFIGAFIIHSIIAVLGKEREKRLVLITLYSAAILMTVLFVIFPDLFLLPSVPKMYFPNYYNPGILNFSTRIVFMYVICVPYSIYELLKARKDTTNPVIKQQLKFFAIAIIVGFSLGFIPNFLVYNIPVDPVVGMFFFSLFTIPIVYGAVRYEFLNIKVIARQAFFYSLGVVIVGGFITLLNNANLWLTERAPGFPVWIIPLISSILAVTVSVIVWRKLREADLLKYEFITTVTHKFRTPLTHVKWATENLEKIALPEEGKSQLEYIESANTKLVELTGLLMNVSEAENSSYSYRLERSRLSDTVAEVIAPLDAQIREKNVTLVKRLDTDTEADFDLSRIKFITQTFIENALHYAPNDATLTVSVYRTDKEVICSVKDTGIGISKDELPYLFSKFYRGKQARLADTEGMGIGLYIAREIMVKHHGRIWAESEGAGKGSTFSFALPVAA